MEKTDIKKNIMKNRCAGFLRYENLKNTITYECGRVVLSCKSVYFATSKLTLSFSYSFHVPCTITRNISCFPFFLIDQIGKQMESRRCKSKSHLCFHL